MVQAAEGTQFTDHDQGADDKEEQAPCNDPQLRPPVQRHPAEETGRMMM